MSGWTCRDIYNVVCEHTDGYMSIYICIHDWANKEGGQLVINNMGEDAFLRLLGDGVPTDWHISSGNGCIDLGFLF